LLYLEVIREAKRYADQHFPVESLSDESLPVDDRIAYFIRNFCRCLLDRSRPAWHGRLMAREIADPDASGGSGLTLMVEEFIRPTSQMLESLLGEYLYGKTPRKGRLTHAQIRRIRLCVASIYGQCLHFHHGRSVMAKLYPDELPPSDQIEFISQGIIDFTLGALQSLRGTPPDVSKPAKSSTLSKGRK